MRVEIANSIATQWKVLEELAELLRREIPKEAKNKRKNGDDRLAQHRRKQKREGLHDEAVGLYVRAYEAFWREMEEPCWRRLEELHDAACRLYGGSAISPDSLLAFRTVQDHFDRAISALSADPIDPQKIVDALKEIPRSTTVLQWHNDNLVRISFDPRRHKRPERVTANFQLRTA